jgi:hypothetical protein
VLCTKQSTHEVAPAKSTHEVAATAKAPNKFLQQQTTPTKKVATGNLERPLILKQPANYKEGKFHWSLIQLQETNKQTNNKPHLSNTPQNPMHDS